MPEEERGYKQLGRRAALSHLMQLGLTLLLGILVMGEPWPSTFAWRAVYGGFGVVYALQVCSDHALLAQPGSGMSVLDMGKPWPFTFSMQHVLWLWHDERPPVAIFRCLFTVIVALNEASLS